MIYKKCQVFNPFESLVYILVFNLGRKKQLRVNKLV